MALIDLRNATIHIADGGVNSVEIKIGQGNLTYSEKKQKEPVKSRGKLDTVRENEDQEMEVAFNFMWEYLKATGLEIASIEDCLKRRGAAAGWVSACPDIKAPYSVHITVVHIPPCQAVYKETILLPQFNVINLAHSLLDATVAATGWCNATEAIITRSPQT